MTVHDEIRRLNTLPVPALKTEYENRTGEPARSNNRVFLVKRLAWRWQADREGGLTDALRVRAHELARDRDLRIRPHPDVHAAYREVAGQPIRDAAVLPPVGAIITKTYKGRRLEVRVLERGFEHEGVIHTSLSAVARHITGGNWNGRLFFGLTKRGSAA